MNLVPFVVAFDGADPFEVQPTSRDLVKMEKDGIDLQATTPLVGSYTLAYYALSRLDRQDKLPAGVQVPKSLDAFMDAADIDAVDDGDPEGNGSGQVPTPGSSAD